MASYKKRIAESFNPRRAARVCFLRKLCFNFVRSYKGKTSSFARGLVYLLQPVLNSGAGKKKWKWLRLLILQKKE